VLKQLKIVHPTTVLLSKLIKMAATWQLILRSVFGNTARALRQRPVLQKY